MGQHPRPAGTRRPRPDGLESQAIVGVSSDPVTRWILLEQRRKASTQRLLRRFVSLTARADEYYRALDKLGNTIDFYLAAIRNTKAAKRFLSKALRGLQARLSS